MRLASWAWRKVGVRVHRDYGGSEAFVFGTRTDAEQEGEGGDDRIRTGQDGIEAVTETQTESADALQPAEFAQARRTAATVLRDSSERDDRQMLPVGRVTHVERHLNAGSAADERMRPSTRRPSGPSRARFMSRCAARRAPAVVDLVGSACDKSFMRPVGVVPAAPKRQLACELGLPERHEHQSSRALALERPHRTLDDGDAAVLTDGARPSGRRPTGARNTPSPA